MNEHDIKLNKKKIDFKDVFSSEKGQKVLDDLSSFCKIEDSLCNEAEPDIDTLLINEGKRRVYLYIKRMMKGTVND